jgi:hypothetical protein
MERMAAEFELKLFARRAFGTTLARTTKSSDAPQLIPAQLDKS